ncbi:hypothetical protein DYBT9275_01983 [Dyadobacter sp. CECT 9275]|uniref:Two component regulator three Y domain-containing protein n=2 Tax=Dyadobacter helix TaxID=2822344 RepID=A0A916NBX4_9BACT|nr:hypothetical protein DYBT9275_01983 [Dyadobacter sp. CECT 9275]
MQITFLSILSFMILIATPARSQSSYLFRHIGVEDGLSQGSVNHMYQDSRGFMWLGTQDGVNRFDGKNIITYLSGATGESTHIQGIAEDNQGNLWAGSREGLFKYNRKTNRFIRPAIKIPTGTNACIENGSVYAFNYRKQIYLLSDKGLYTIVDNEARLITPELRYNNLLNNNFLAESPEGDLWFIHVSGGLIRYSVSAGKVYHYFSNDKNNLFGNPRKFKCIAFDRIGFLWLGGPDGLTRFDYEQKRKDDFKGNYNFTRHNPVAIIEDRYAKLWLATEGNGILIFDRIRMKFSQQIQHRDDVPNSLKYDEVGNLFIDQNNDVFANIGTQGLDIISPVSNAFKFYSYGKNPMDNLGDYSVRGLAEDAQGDIWIGTELGGINRLTPSKGSIKHYTSADGLPGNTIRHILYDRQNNIWVGTSSGIALFMPVQNTFRAIPLPVSCEVLTLLQITDNLVLITTSAGLMALDTKTKSVVSFSNRQIASGYASYQDTLTEQIYVAERYQGVSIFGLRGIHLVLKSRVLKDFHVLQFYQEPGTPFLWMCTDRGLVKWNMEKKEIEKNYRIRDGLHHEYLYALLPDAKGDFWLSTNRGLTRFEPVNERFELVIEIPLREYNSRAALVTRKGMLYFGSTTGLDQISPDQLTSENQEIGISLTELSVDTKGPKDTDTYIGEVSSLELPYEQNTISLKFTATDYRNRGLNRFRYFLKNYDTDTIYAGTMDQVRYANLPAGIYTFNVQASDLGGNWISPVKKLNIHILPPFWLTWWFILLILTLLAILVWGGIRYLLHSRLLNQKTNADKKISMEKERSRIARDMNDSLGSELFGLKLLGQVALSRPNRTDSDTYLQKIVDTSRNISEKISEVIWLTDASQDTLESLWTYIQKNAAMLLKPANIPYWFQTLNGHSSDLVSGERRHEILDFHKLLFMKMIAASSQAYVLELRTYRTNLLIIIKNPGPDILDCDLSASLSKLNGSVSQHESAAILEIPFAD